MEIVNIYEDAGKSGKSIEGRPAFKQMLNDIENGLNIDYVLVYKLSRFGQNAADLQCIQKIKQDNGTLTHRLNSLYDIIVELEEKIEDVKLRRKAVEQEAITLENIYTLLASFDKVYDKISDEEKKSLISSLIKEIEIFPCDESELPLKSILFNFPVYKDGRDIYEFLWDKSTHVSTHPVQGNISTGVASKNIYPISPSKFTSLASVAGSQET